MPKVNKNAQLKHLKQVEKDCKQVETELKKLLKEIDTVEKNSREDEWKKNRQDCQERIKQVNEYYSDKIDVLEEQIKYLKKQSHELERLQWDIMKYKDLERQEEIREMNKNIGSWWKDHS